MDLIKNNLLIHSNLINVMGHGTGSECTRERQGRVFDSNYLCNLRKSADELLWVCGQEVHGNHNEPSQQIMGWGRPSLIQVKPVFITISWLLFLHIEREKTCSWMITLKNSLHYTHKSQGMISSLFSHSSISNVKSPCLLFSVYSWWNTSSLSLSCNEIQNSALSAHI